jgi:AcrR family transcriptional regulator
MSDNQLVVTARVDEPRHRTSRARTALIDATHRLVARSAFATFSIDDVTCEARVARGSFYNHFATIDDLIATTQALVQAQMNDEIAEAIADSPDAATSMVRGMAVLMRFGYVNKANARLLLTPGPGTGDPDHPANRELTAALREGMADGEFHLRNIEAGVVATRGIAEFGLARMIDIHHELSAVRELTTGMCISVLRAIGADPRRIDALVDDAMKRCFPPP